MKSGLVDSIVCDMEPLTRDWNERLFIYVVIMLALTLKTAIFQQVGPTTLLPISLRSDRLWIRFSVFVLFCTPPPHTAPTNATNPPTPKCLQPAGTQWEITSNRRNPLWLTMGVKAKWLPITSGMDRQHFSEVTDHCRAEKKIIAHPWSWSCQEAQMFVATTAYLSLFLRFL